MPNILDFFKRRGREEPPDPGDWRLQFHGPFNPFGDPPRPLEYSEGPCIRCGEETTRNKYLFCYGCWLFATDLARWAVEKKQDLGITNYQDGDEVEIPVIQWAFVFASKWPRDPGPDYQDPTYPDTIVPKGSYWQPEGGRVDPEHGKVRGICSCHFFRWN